METKTETPDICSICRNDIDYKKSVLTSCNHYFCSTCFFKWMERKADCPVCRKVFKEQTNYDIEVEREVLEQLESEVRDYTSLVEQLREQAFNAEYKRNSMIKLCYDLDETLNKKKEEFNNVSKNTRELMNTKIKLANDIDKNIRYLNELNNRIRITRNNIATQRRRNIQRRQFGLNLR